MSGASDPAAALANATAAAEDAFKATVSQQGPLCDADCTLVGKDGKPLANDPPSLADLGPAMVEAGESGTGTYKWVFEFSCVKAVDLKYIRPPSSGSGGSVWMQAWDNDTRTINPLTGRDRVALAVFAARLSGARVHVHVQDAGGDGVGVD